MADLTTSANVDTMMASADNAGILSAIGAAPLASPTFTGTPAADTAAPGTSTTQLATTAFVAAAVAASPWLVKTANYTAVAGQAIQADTSGGAFTVTLPASATAGDTIPIEDATLSWDTDNLTIARNGLKINGGTTDYTANVIGGKLSCVYISAGYGWSIK